ncbi:mitochondrial rRNA methyltransferase [Scheffersomyces xylosifermentans]|uniref:mitochondrial rRNA methyltransferase n=1 Tax=Scheffersomyces xylosifermentans TaxID=1304137 RepID=UPI00315CD6CE
MYIAARIKSCETVSVVGLLTSVRHKSKSSTRWINRQVNDPHTKQSKSQNYRSRAAYKLIEIDDKYRLFSRKTRNILDLGFAPGAWTQVAIERMKKLGVKSTILGVDLIECTPPQGSHFIQGNILSKQTHSDIRDFFSKTAKEEEEEADEEDASNTVTNKKSHEESKFSVDLVLSDMMANTSGIKDNDHYASMDLCDGAIILSCELLKPGGSLVMKFFTGKEDQVLLEKMKTLFEKVYRFKPQACRNESREMYVLGMKRRAHIQVNDIFRNE